MKRNRLKIERVFFYPLLVLLILVISSCTNDCPGGIPEVTVINQWNRTIHIELYTHGYVTHSTTLHVGEQITMDIDENEVEIRSREKGFLLFPDRTTAQFDARGCWRYEAIAYTDPNNPNRHYLEINQNVK